MFAFFFAAAVAAQSPDTSPQIQAAEGKTIESAQAYLRNVMMRGTTKMVLRTGPEGQYWGKKVTVERVYGSGCSTTFTATASTPRERKQVGRKIDWALVSEVTPPNVYIAGRIETLDGTVLDGAIFEAESEPVQDRVLNAMNFLKEQCTKADGDPWAP
jgi:hypothetical protein